MKDAKILIIGLAMAIGWVIVGAVIDFWLFPDRSPRDIVKLAPMGLSTVYGVAVFWLLRKLVQLKSPPRLMPAALAVVAALLAAGALYELRFTVRLAGEIWPTEGFAALHRGNIVILSGAFIILVVALLLAAWSRWLGHKRT